MDDADSDANDGAEDRMFVIKDLDTGLELKVDDFERLTSLSTEEGDRLAPAPAKKGGLFKGSTSFKSWTQRATSKAKLAVSGVRDKASELREELRERQDRARGAAAATSSSSAAVSGAADTTPLGGEAPASSPASLSSTGTSLEAAAHVEGAAGSGAPPLDVTAPLAAPLQAGASPPGRGSRLRTPVFGGGARGKAAAAAAAAAGASLLATAAAAAGGGGAPSPAGAPIPPPASSAAAAAASSPAAAPAPAPPAAAAVAPALAAARVASNKRSRAGLPTVLLAQSLEGHEGVVWVAKFSGDANFLATGGQDGVLRLWQAACSTARLDDGEGSGTRAAAATAATAAAAAPSDAHASTDASAAAAAADEQRAASGAAAGPPPPGGGGGGGGPPPPSRAPYLDPTPVREWGGHCEDILDLDWSPQSKFLVTASLDKSARLWHIHQPHCLRTFWHPDFVTCCTLHPCHPQLFATGCLDGHVRVWSVSGGRVVAAAHLHQDSVCALAWARGGGQLVAGTLKGKCRFYEFRPHQGVLEYITQVDVRNARGAHAGGKKITSITAIPGEPSQLLVSSNDSRLRLYDGYSQLVKYKGHRNLVTQVRAAVSPRGDSVACGADDGWVHLWGRLPPGEGAARGGGGGGSGVAGKHAGSEAFLALGPGDGPSGGGGPGGAPVTSLAFVPPAVRCGGDGGVAPPPLGVREGTRLRHALVVAGWHGALRVYELWGDSAPGGG